MPQANDSHESASPIEGCDSLLSRTSGHGKLLVELKTKVDDATAEAFVRIVAEGGTTTAGALRDFIHKTVHGETYTDMVIREANVMRQKMMRTGLGEALHGPR